MRTACRCGPSASINKFISRVPFSLFPLWIFLWHYFLNRPGSLINKSLIIFDMLSLYIWLSHDFPFKSFHFKNHPRFLPRWYPKWRRRILSALKPKPEQRHWKPRWWCRETQKMTDLNITHCLAAQDPAALGGTPKTLKSALKRNQLNHYAIMKFSLPTEKSRQQQTCVRCGVCVCVCVGQQEPDSQDVEKCYDCGVAKSFL